MEKNLSKTRYCSACRCEKMAWIDVNRPEMYEAAKREADTDLERGRQIGAAAQGYYGEPTIIPFSDKLSDMISETEKAIREKKTVIAEASFSWNGCFCAIDIMQILDFDKKICTLTEVKAATKFEEHHLIDMAYQAYVLQGAGWTVEKFYHMHVNSSYMLPGDEVLNPAEMFERIDMTDDVFENIAQVEMNTGIYKRMLGLDNEPQCELGRHCFKPEKCEYFGYCTSHLPTPNVFNLQGSGLTFNKKLQMYGQNVITFEDVLANPCGMNPKRINEVRAYVSNQPYPVKYEELEEFMDTIRYPLYFLDFETYQESIPTHYWEKPYQQIPFQYSLHWLDTPDGELHHVGRIAPIDVDPREYIAENLVKDIPDTAATILAYNDRFEKDVIKQLAGISWKTFKKLLAIHDKIDDLMIPFSNQWVYTPAMKAKYSIKNVAPALFPGDPECDYLLLEGIHNGSEAMQEYAGLKYKSEEERAVIFHQLDLYCTKDTYMMVKILRYLNKLLNERPEFPPC